MATTSGDKGGDSRRRTPRVRGPFDGRRIGASTVAIRIHNLSVAGCLIQSSHDLPVGQQMTIEIDLPYEGTVRLDAESVQTRPGYGFGVKFVDVTDDVLEKVERVIEWWVALSRHDQERR